MYDSLNPHTNDTTGFETEKPVNEERVIYICQLPESEQNAIREKLKAYMTIEGFRGEELEQHLQDAMDSKIDDIDWRGINAILEPQKYYFVVQMEHRFYGGGVWYMTSTFPYETFEEYVGAIPQDTSYVVAYTKVPERLKPLLDNDLPF